MEIVRRLRKATHGLLVTLQQGAKPNGPGESSGNELSLDDWLEHHHRHILHHIVQMTHSYETGGELIRSGSRHLPLGDPTLLRRSQFLPRSSSSFLRPTNIGVFC